MSKGIKDLLIDELEDMLSAEKQIVKALPTMVAAAESPELKKAFAGHLVETKEQVKRLEKAFSLLGEKSKEKFCKGTRGLIQECEEVLKEFKTKSYVRDAALISKAQRIEHYEISAYGTMKTYAQELGLKTIAALLNETLTEEGNADKKLTKIAVARKTGINLKANAQKVTESKGVKKVSKASPSKPAKKVTSPKKPSATPKKTSSTSKKTAKPVKKAAASAKKASISKKSVGKKK